MDIPFNETDYWSGNNIDNIDSLGLILSKFSICDADRNERLKIMDNTANNLGTNREYDTFLTPNFASDVLSGIVRTLDSKQAVSKTAVDQLATAYSSNDENGNDDAKSANEESKNNDKQMMPKREENMIGIDSSNDDIGGSSEDIIIKYNASIDSQLLFLKDIAKRAQPRQNESVLQLYSVAHQKYQPKMNADSECLARLEHDERDATVFCFIKSGSIGTKLFIVDGGNSTEASHKDVLLLVLYLNKTMLQLI